MAVCCRRVKGGIWGLGVDGGEGRGGSGSQKSQCMKDGLKLSSFRNVTSSSVEQRGMDPG